MKKIFSFLLTLVIIFTLAACSSTDKNIDTSKSNQNGSKSKVEKVTPADTPKEVTIVDGLKVHFIDVGQADCILIQSGSSNMLIDAGNRNDAAKIIQYLKKNKVSKIDILVATHPHEDHIGAIDEVIKTFDIGTIYASNAQTTTQTYKDFINAVKNKGLKLTNAVPGADFGFGHTMCTILAPNNSKYDNLNNYSVVIKLVYENTSFLFTGDAESLSEGEILNKGYNISSDVLKIGHHGSTSSTSSAFLKKVNPKYAVISVGHGNDYGHPAASTLTKLNEIGAKVYRTDKNGTIVATSDGTKITFTSIP